MPDAAPLLAGRFLADIAGFLTVTLDPSFSLIRYAGSLASANAAGPGLRDFSWLRSNLDGYVMQTFYRPFLQRRWEAAVKGERKDEGGSPGTAGPLCSGATASRITGCGSP